MSQLAIVEAFKELPDPRRSAGQRHHQALCLALFTLAVTAGNHGFLAIGLSPTMMNYSPCSIPPNSDYPPTVRFVVCCSISTINATQPA